MGTELPHVLQEGKQGGETLALCPLWKKKRMEGREEKQERKGGRVTVGSQRPPKSASVSRLFMCLQGDGEGTVKH